MGGGVPDRLDAFLHLLGGIVTGFCIGIDLTQISDPGLLILPTRRFVHPFTENELDFIDRFVSQGNPLLHLSNHPPKLTREDTRLGERFGYSFQHFVEGPEQGKNFEVYPIYKPNSVFGEIDQGLRFVIRNSSAVIPDSESFIVIADYSRSGLTSEKSGSAFAIARPRIENYGAIVALGDSGILGKPTENNPGPGLCAGDNKELIRQVVCWLMNQTA